jgi:hypothetical protein
MPLDFADGMLFTKSAVTSTKFSAAACNEGRSPYIAFSFLRGP